MKGFSLIEAIVALVVLQVVVLGVLGRALVAIRTAEAAETTALRARAAASLLDSLRSRGEPGSGSTVAQGVSLEWAIDSTGILDIVAESPDGGTLEVGSVLLLR